MMVGYMRVSSEGDRQTTALQRDALLAAGVDDRIRRDLFGHRLDRERYGRGASLEHLHAVILSIAL